MTQEDEAVAVAPGDGAQQRASTAPPSRKLCETHGLWYEPRIASGCVVCRRPPPAIETPAPKKVPWLAVVAVAANVLLLAFVLNGGSVRSLFIAEPAPPEEVEPNVAEPSAPSSAPEPAPAPREESAVATVEPAAPSRCKLLARGGDALSGREQLPKGGLHFAAGTGDLARVREEIALGMPLDLQDDGGRTPLAWALLLAQREVALALIEARANPNTPTRAGETPLMLAAASGDRDVVNALLAAGARPAEVNREQQTALMLAARAGRLYAVDALASNAVTREMTCERGMTALHYAALNSDDCESVAALLQEHGALVDARDREGATPFLYAIEHGHDSVARLLLQRGADINARDYKDRGAFDYVVRHRTGVHIPPLRSTLQILIDRKADRRLGVDPRTTEILFRKELNDLATREGRATLPSYVGPLAEQPRAGSSRSARPRLGTLQVFPRWELRPGRHQLPPFSQSLITINGWRMVPQIVARYLVSDIAYEPGQRVTISGRGDDLAGFTMRGGLLIEMHNGGDAIHIGREDEVKVYNRVINRGSRNATYFSAGEIDLTWLFNHTTSVVFTALADDWGFAMSDIHLIVEGPNAAATAAQMKVQPWVPLPR